MTTAKVSVTPGSGADVATYEISEDALTKEIQRVALNTNAGVEISPATSAKQDTLAALIGEVQASPTANTVLDRLKALLTGIVIAAGSAIIGKVGIDQTTPGTTNGVQVNAALPAGTNAIGGIFGYWATATTQFTRPNDTTAYAANDAMSDSTSAPTTGGFTLSNVARASGGSGIITDMVIGISTAAATSLQGEIWIFDQAVTNINDNAAFALSDGDRDTLVGIVPFTTASGATNNASAWVSGLNLGFTCVGTANLRYLVKVLNAYTPAALEVLTVRAKVSQVT